VNWFLYSVGFLGAVAVLGRDLVATRFVVSSLTPVYLVLPNLDAVCWRAKHRARHTTPHTALLCRCYLLGALPPPTLTPLPTATHGISSHTALRHTHTFLTVRAWRAIPSPTPLPISPAPGYISPARTLPPPAPTTAPTTPPRPTYTPTYLLHPSSYVVERLARTQRVCIRYYPVCRAARAVPSLGWHAAAAGAQRHCHWRLPYRLPLLHCLLQTGHKAPVRLPLFAHGRRAL